MERYVLKYGPGGVGEIGMCSFVEEYSNYNMIVSEKNGSECFFSCFEM